MYAFESSNYPLIISIENHCKRENQKLMATLFRNIFGGLLGMKKLEVLYWVNI